MQYHHTFDKAWVLSRFEMKHDDVIKWKHFPRYWPFVTGEFPSQGPVTRSVDVSLICALNKRLSKQSWGWWFETPSRSLWRYCNETHGHQIYHTKRSFIDACTYCDALFIRADEKYFFQEWLGLLSIDSVFVTLIQASFNSHFDLEIITSTVKSKTAVSPLITHWKYCSLALSHRYRCYGCLRISEDNSKQFWRVKKLLSVEIDCFINKTCIVVRNLNIVIIHIYIYTCSSIMFYTARKSPLRSMAVSICCRSCLRPVLTNTMAVDGRARQGAMA